MLFWGYFPRIARMGILFRFAGKRLESVPERRNTREEFL
jgi:hypothetical protein